MIAYVRQNTFRTLAVVLCLALFLGEVACCEGRLIKRFVEQCGERSEGDCCISNEGPLCPSVNPCDSVDCSTKVLPCIDPFIKAFEPGCIEAHGSTFNVDLKIKGSNLDDVKTVLFDPAELIEITHIISVTESEVLLKIDVFPGEIDEVRVQVLKANGEGSNIRTLYINSCPDSSAGTTPLSLLRKSPFSLAVRSREQSLAQNIPTGSLVFTPVCDGTVQQLDAGIGQTASTNTILTAGPATIAHATVVSSTPFPLNVIDRQFSVNFLRFGLTTGGFLDVDGTTRVEEFATSLPVPASRNATLTQAAFGAAGAVEFDLTSLKTALKQLNIDSSSVRASLRLTPIRSLNMFDFVSSSPVHLPSTTRVVLLDMTQDQKDLVIDYQDFPGFASPRRSNLVELSTTIANGAEGRRATVRTDLLGLLAPLSFDVTTSVQNGLKRTSAKTGFQVASELNGTGLVFADSSNYIPGLSETTAPQLVIELDGFNPPAQPLFVASATRIPFDYLAEGSTDMMLVTVNNIGGKPGTIELDLGAGSNAFGMLTTDGRAIETQSRATIAPGERLTFAVSFKPTNGDKFQGELQVIATNGTEQNVVSKIALTGATFPTSFSAGFPSITVPIKPTRLPSRSARVGDLNGDGLIDAVDAGALSAIVTGRTMLPQPGSEAYAVSDINGDGAINFIDLALLGEALSGNIDSLPRLQPVVTEFSPGMSPARRR